MEIKNDSIEKYKPIVAFSHIGIEYTLHIKKCLESLGIEVRLPPKISQNTIKVGVKNSADMVCYPYKVTLGSYVEALESGANTLLAFNSCGQCRLRHYHKIQEFSLRRMGYDNFKLYGVSGFNVVRVLKELSGCSTIAALKTIKELVKGFEKIDDMKYKWSKDKPNVGIIGEIYSCCEQRVNFDIEKKLKALGVNPYNTSNLSSFIYEIMHFSLLQKRKYKKLAKKYFNGKLGGHGIENVYNLLWMIDNNVEGIIHIMPLSCAPETMAEPVINGICQDNNTPLLRMMCDETSSDANIDTRVETFVETIFMRKNGTLHGN